MDQMQARPQTVSRARARESANGNAVGLPHLQPAAVGQTAKNWFPGSCDLLKRDRTIRSAHNQKRNKSETLHPTKTLQIDGFFTASNTGKGRAPSCQHSAVKYINGMLRSYHANSRNQSTKGGPPATCGKRMRMKNLACLLGLLVQVV